MSDSTISNLPAATALTGTEVTPMDQAGLTVKGSADQINAYTLSKLAVPTGSSLVGFKQAGAGAVNRTVQDKSQDIVSIRDFGGSPSNPDNYAAALAAYNAAPSGCAIKIPPGVYNFLTAPTFGSKRLSWIGDGGRESVFNYAGVNTTNDCFTFGDGVTELNGLRIEGIGFSSSTLMTSGAGVHFKLLTRSYITDVLFDHQDGNGNFWHGMWLDGCDFVPVDGYQARAQQDGIRVNGAPGSATVGARADFYLLNGKIGKCTVGIHVGGAMGGVYVDASDIIGNLTNVLIDQTINTFGNNRETFFGPGCALDSAGSSSTPFSGINLDIQDTSGFVFFSSPWNASASILIRTGSSFTGVLKLDGGLLYNAINTSGGPGNGIQIGNAAANIQVNSTRFKTINGTAITCPSGVTTFANIINPIFESDVTVKYDNNVRPLPIMSKGRLIVGGGDSNFACAVDGNPTQTLYQGGNYGSAFAIGYFSNNTSGGWIELAKSRGAVPGVHGLVTSNDFLGGINFSGSDGSVFKSAGTVKVVAAGTPSSGIVPGRMMFATANTSGAIVSNVWLLENGNFAPVTTNSVSLGQSGLLWSSIWSANGTIQTSDARTKTDVIDSTLGLSFINKLRPVSYKWIEGSKKVIRQDVNEDGTPGEIITESTPGSRTHCGLIAQEVKSVVDTAGVDFAGWVLSDVNDPNSQQALRYDQFISPLIKAVQELTARITALEAK